MDPQHRIGFKDAHQEQWPFRVGKRSVFFFVHHLPVCFATIIRILIDTVYYVNNIRFISHFNIGNSTRVFTRQIMAPKISTKSVWLTQKLDHAVKRHSNINLLYIAILYRIPVRTNIPARIHQNQKRKQHKCHKYLFHFFHYFVTTKIYHSNVSC